MIEIPQLPPHDIQAEESVLASLMVAPEAIDAVAEIVKPGDFFRETNAWTYTACLELWQRNEPINQVTLAHELDRAGRLEAVGGLSYLSEMVMNLASPVGVEHYAAIVARDATYRRLITAAMNIAKVAYDAGPNLEASIAKAENIISTVRGDDAASGFVHLSKYLDPYLETPEPGASERGAHGNRLRSGLNGLDDTLDGWNPSDLVIVAARTGVGKTALMLNFARNAAVNEGAKVAVFSLEMAGDQLAQRLLSMQSNVDAKRLRLGTHTEVEESRIMHAHGALSSAEIYVDDNSNLRIPQLRSKLTRLKREVGVDLVIVDYLQLMESERGGRDGNRVQELSYITRNLKLIAKDLDVPILAGSQLSRAVDVRTSHIPQLSDLRESGSIEHDADVVVFIHREDKWTTRAEWEAAHADRVASPYPEGIAQLIVAKHRNGPEGVAETRFEAKLGRFEDVESDTRQERLI